MPWQHCGLSVTDDQACPTCGFRKGQWTVKRDRTRMFRLGKAWEGDVEAQVETLKRAAAEGTPFCEECERYKAEQAEEAAPYDGDTAAQVQALKEAAQSGAPFCEECEKAKQEQAAQQPVGGAA